MNHTPYDPYVSAKITHTKKWSKTVVAKEMKMLVGWVTICLAVCAVGHKLLPMLVYKGQFDKQIMKEMQHYSKDDIYIADEWLM